MYTLKRISPSVLFVPLLLLASFGASRAADAQTIAIELDGQIVAPIDSFEGGGPVGDVEEDVAGEWIAKKHVAGVKYEDITVAMGAGASRPFYDWISASFDGKSERKSGSIIMLDRDSKEIARLYFVDALITEVTVPALDAGSKDAAKMTIKIKPEYTRIMKGSGKKDEMPPVKQKSWTASNFRFSVDGVGDATARVAKIDSFTWKQTIAVSDKNGEPVLVPGRIEVPNLKVILPFAASDSVQDWATSFLVNGQNTDQDERSGSLDILSDKGDTLFTLKLSHVGIFKLTPEKMEAGAEGIRRVKAELYVEQMSFTAVAAAQ